MTCASCHLFAALKVWQNSHLVYHNGKHKQKQKKLCTEAMVAMEEGRRMC